MNIGDYVASDRCSCCGQALNIYWTPTRMVEALKAWVEEHGKLPRSTDWHHGTPTTPPQARVCEVFGQWNNLVRAAGLTPHKCGQRPWAKDEIADAMLDHLLRHGQWPSTLDWSSRATGVRRPHYQTVLRHFGSWAAAKRYAGWTEEDPVDHVEPRCPECGTELDNHVIDCGTCHERHRGRRRRAVTEEATNV